MRLSFAQAIGVKYGKLLVFLVLALLVVLIYGQTLRYEFVSYDDSSYITENRHVRAGLSVEGIRWALQDISTGYWHPLTWISHMLDVQLFGLHAGGHHLTSLLLHLANSFLLFLFFLRCTGDFWKSACVAALFAVHPLNVESVAWAAERKNVLSTFFWLAAMGAYASYVQRPAWGRYGLVLALFVLGLTAKPMVVTFPFALLLMDYWPLERIKGIDYSIDQALPKRTGAVKKTMAGLIREKAPLFILSAAVSAATFLAQKQEGALPDPGALPFASRLINALLSYGRYALKLFWPRDLAVFYPYGGMVTYLEIAGALILLFAVSLLALGARKKIPALLAGWCWYLGTLVPVIGLVQAGGQAMADRYAYIPFIGLYVIVVWGIPPLLRIFSCRRGFLLAFVAAALVTLMLISWRQAGYWRDSSSLYKHALGVTSANALAHNNLGVALAGQGKIAEAVDQYERALKINPNYRDALNNLGIALKDLGRLEEASFTLSKLLKSNPRYAAAHNNLGLVLSRQGRIPAAMDHYKTALTLKPDYADAHNNLAVALAGQGKLSEALPHFLEALRFQPDDAQLQYNAGLAFLQRGDYFQARRHFKRARELDPRFVAARRQLDLLENK